MSRINSRPRTPGRGTARSEATDGRRARREREPLARVSLTIARAGGPRPASSLPVSLSSCALATACSLTAQGIPARGRRSRRFRARSDAWKHRRPRGSASAAAAAAAGDVRRDPGRDRPAGWPSCAPCAYAAARRRNVSWTKQPERAGGACERDKEGRIGAYSSSSVVTATDQLSHLARSPVTRDRLCRKPSRDPLRVQAPITRDFRFFSSCE